ncbi:MAG: hypothetical protein IPK77_04535 [Cellvibrio sp.]|nr:hypothetical protein [Cellvibrio sp.]
MKGSWEKPKMKFDRLFESEDSLRKRAQEYDTQTNNRSGNKIEKDDVKNISILESNPDLKTQSQ